MKPRYISTLKFVCMLWFLVGQVFGQPPVKIEHYSTEDGLSHDVITCMFKDSRGYMWFGTWNGISRFDGHNFTSFTSSPGDLSQIKNDRIDRIFEDKTNHLWIKSYDGHIYRFDKGTERFTPLSEILSFKKEISFERIFQMDDGKLWASTGNQGVIMVNDLGGPSPSYQVFNSSTLPGAKLPTGKTNFIFKDSATSYWIGNSNGLIHVYGQKKMTAKMERFGGLASEEFSAAVASPTELYFGTASGELVVIDKRTRQHHRISVSKSRLNGLLVSKKTGDLHVTTANGELVTFDPRHGTIKNAKYGQNVSLFSIFEDRKGNLWLEPQKRGVVLFNVRTQRFTTFTQKNDAQYNLPHNHFKTFEDKNGTVWAVLRDGGFGYYDDKIEKFSYFYNEPGSSKRLLSNLTFVHYYDPSGVMWLHTDQRGLEKVIFHPNDFKQQLLVDPSLFKSQNEVRGILNDRKNRIWAGVKSGLLYVYDRGNRVQINFENLPSGGLGMVYSIMQAKNGVVWIGTKEKGIYKAEPLNSAETKYRLTHYQNDANDPNSISSNQVYAIAEDKHGKIWAGTFDSGLNCIDPQQNGRTFKRYDENSNGYPRHFQKIRHLTFDDKNRLWIGSTDGLVVGTPKIDGTMSFQTYDKRPGDPNSLGSNDVQYILKDHQGKMWLATSGGGLNLAVEKAGSPMRFNIYSTKNGLGNNYILSCVEDQQHQIWMATKSTLTRFDPLKGKFDNFNSYDGVPNDGFSEASCQPSKDGKLIFGTNKGLLSFDPSQIKYHPIKANIVFTGLEINNEDVPVGEADGLLTNNINETKELALRYNQNTISVDYTVLDFRDVNRQSYLYRLKGFDTTWHDNKNQRRATYTNLPPGDYVLEVRSQDLDNYSTLPSKQLKINIAPPPWKTWWAYLIYFLLFTVLIEAARRIAVTFLRLRQGIVVEQKMTALKMAFFTNVSHELRTPLTLIVNPIEELLQQEKQLSQQGKEYASIVQRNALRMVRFVNELLDLRKAQSGQAKLKKSKIELANFISEVARNFEEFAKSNQITLEINSSQPLEVFLDANKMETVIYNLLSNSFKFSPPGKRIVVDIVQQDETFQIVVNDEGCGVNDADLEHIFLLYHESEHPDTQQFKGTGIGLALAKELVELHGGTIRAQNREEQGLSITITLPLALMDRLPATPPNAEETVLLPSNDALIEQEEVKEQMIEKIENDCHLVLLVEDNEDMRSFLSVNLSATYRIKTAVDGVQGLAMAKKWQPDLILSDIMMPKMDGIAMLDQLKQDQETSHIPVILLSAKSAVETQIEGLKYGADFYISKPFDNELLFAALSNILEQRKRITEQLVTKRKVLDLSPSQIVVTSKDELFLQKVISIVEENMTDPKFNIDAVAETVHMARATFFKKFKSLTQQAPVEFIRDMRLKRAKQYLDAGMGNITEIAYTVGFSSAKYFSTCFRVLYGVSPSDYLKSLESTKGVR